MLAILKMLIPNEDQIYSWIRSALLAEGTTLASHGIFVTGNQIELITGGLTAAIAIVLSTIFHSVGGQSLTKNGPTP